MITSSFLVWNRSRFSPRFGSTNHVGILMPCTRANSNGPTLSSPWICVSSEVLWLGALGSPVYTQVSVMFEYNQQISWGITSSTTYIYILFWRFPAMVHTRNSFQSMRQNTDVNRGLYIRAGMVNERLWLGSLENFVYIVIHCTHVFMTVLGP